MKFNKTASLVVTALLLILCIGAIILALHWPFSQARVAKALQEAFPATVTFEKFHSTYFPHPGCVGEGVVFRRLGRSQNVAPVVTIQRLSVEARYTDLFLRPGYLARIVMSGFRVQVPPTGTPREQSAWSETKSTTRIGEIIANGSTIEIARGEGNPSLLFDVHTLKLSSVSPSQALSFEVALRNPVPPGEIRAQGQFGPWNGSDPGQTQISGNDVFQNADLGVFHGVAGLLSSQGKFQGTLGHIESQGSIDIPDFMVTRSDHSVHLTAKFHAFIDGTNGDVELQSVSAAFLQTRVLARGQVAGRQGQHGKTVAVDLTVHQGHIQDVLRLFVHGKKSPLNGTTNFRAHVVIPPEKRPFIQKMRLTGDFGVDDAQFTKPSTQKDIGTLSEKAQGTKADAKRVDEDPEGVVSELAGHVELRQATASFANLSFQVPGASAQLHGTYNLKNETVDLHGTLKTVAELSDMTSGFKSVLLKPFDSFFKRKHAGAVVPVRLVGTYAHPEAGLDLPLKGSSGKPAAAAK